MNFNVEINVIITNLQRVDLSKEILEKGVKMVTHHYIRISICVIYQRYNTVLRQICQRRLYYLFMLVELSYNTVLYLQNKSKRPQV